MIRTCPVPAPGVRFGVMRTALADGVTLVPAPTCPEDDDPAAVGVVPFNAVPSVASVTVYVAAVGIVVTT